MVVFRFPPFIALYLFDLSQTFFYINLFATKYKNKRILKQTNIITFCLCVSEHNTSLNCTLTNPFLNIYKLSKRIEPGKLTYSVLSPKTNNTDIYFMIQITVNHIKVFLRTTSFLITK